MSKRYFQNLNILKKIESPYIASIDVDNVNLYANNVSCSNLSTTTFSITNLTTSNINVKGNLSVSGDINFTENLDLFTIPFSKNTVSTISPVSSDCEGGVLATNGKIYGIPRTATSVLIIDPNDNTIDTTTLSGIPTGNNWTGGVLAPNGKIYCIPYDSDKILVIDPINNTLSYLSDVGITSGGGKWIGGVLASF